jgi:hypothetical protein
MIEPAAFALVPSPFLPAQSWAPAAQALERRGRSAVIIDIAEALDAADHPYEAVGRAAAARLDGPTILVAHSRAGALVPAICHAVGGAVLAAIFVDAGLARPGKSWFQTVPPGLAERIRAGAKDGRAPPWTSLMTAFEFEQLLPNATLRQALAATVPTAPLSFLEEPAPFVAGWAPPRGCAYLQLSPAYRDAAKEAQALGWPVETLQRRHLAHMAEPDDIVEAMLRLARRLGV